MFPSLNRTQLTLPLLASFIAALLFAACEMRLQIPSSTNAPDIQAYEFEATGEDFLISALDEVQAIADWSDSFQNGLSTRLSHTSPAGKKTILAVTSTDTVYIYGQIIPGGYGAVVTERYAHPKGLLLITVRKTFGKANGHIVTETKRYATYADHHNDKPQQTNVTEMYGCQTDTIVAHVIRDGTFQTYTFRLPVVTKVVSPQDGSVRVTKRYAASGAIVSKVEDANGSLIQLSRSYGQTDGSTVTRIEYPDGSWRQVRTRGEADGTVTRETTSGLPTLGSGNTAYPANIPRPVMSSWILVRRGGSFHMSLSHQPKQNNVLLASGAMPPGRPPRPRLSRNDVLRYVITASGNSACPRPPLPTLASGATPCNPRPPLPLACSLASSRSSYSTDPDGPTESFTTFASGISPCPVPPRPAIPHKPGSNLRCLASGTPCPPTNIPRPSIASVGPMRLLLLASGQSMPGPVPRPTFPRYPNTFDSERTCTLFASGNSVSPPVCPRPVMSLNMLTRSRTEIRSTITHTISSARSSLASGATTSPKPPIPVLASGDITQPRPPRPAVTLLAPRSATVGHRPVTTEAKASGEHSLCSGLAISPPRPPRPILA